MAKNLSSTANEEIDDEVFEDDDSSPPSLFDNGSAMGGRDHSIRRRIEERLERRRLLEELGLLDEELEF